MMMMIALRDMRAIIIEYVECEPSIPILIISVVCIGFIILGSLRGGRRTRGEYKIGRIQIES